MKDQERMQMLMDRLRRLRAQIVEESERSILEVQIHALESELTVLGRRLRNGLYWCLGANMANVAKMDDKGANAA